MIRIYHAKVPRPTFKFCLLSVIMAGMNAHVESEKQTEPSLPMCDLKPYIQDVSQTPLAEGTFSSVFLAHISNLKVAIKTSHKSKTTFQVFKRVL